MKPSRTILTAIACIMLVVAAGCSDDDTVGPAPEEALDRPPIPEPTYYAGPVPEKSMELVVKTVKLSTYIASVDSVWPSPGWCCDGPGCDFQCRFSATYPGPNRMKLVEGDTIVTAYDSLFTNIYYTYPSSYGVMNCNQLSASPYIQHVRYWVRLGSVERYSGSTSVTVTRSTTRGVETTKAEEFGRTIGMSATVSGGLFVNFSATLSAEFSYSSSTSITVSEEETVEESFTIACPDNKNIVYCVWQLVDDFRIFGPGGEPYEDPNYRFTPGTHRAVCPTAEFVPMTTYFDN
ncbi:MAG: hypothetical protein JW876_01985 [Candidatus Krumholzibacteriota bacterium]|nr:hypothetical protein [Candidatus Krumholzibacteriota bacterium]